MADISLILPDGTEDEIEMEVCCPSCSGLTPKEFDWFFAHINNNKPIEIPNQSYCERTALMRFIKEKVK